MNELKKREKEKKKMQLLLSGCYFEPEGKASFVYGPRINKMENDLLASLMYQNRWEMQSQLFAIEKSHTCILTRSDVRT